MALLVSSLRKIGSNVKVLTTKDIEKKYPKCCISNSAKNAWAALEKGFQIAVIENEQLVNNELFISEVALEMVFPGEEINIQYFVDLSELDSNKLYVAFSRDEKKCV